MPTTYKLISKVTVGAGGAASMTFSSIPQTYTDLVLKLSARTNRTTAAYGETRIAFNNSAANFNTRYITGYVSGVNSGSDPTGFIAHSSTDFQTANTFGNAEIYIPNYTSSNNKSYSSDYVNENNSSASESAIEGLVAGLWSNSAAITQIDITLAGGFTFKQYTTARLYGIKNS